MIRCTSEILTRGVVPNSARSIDHGGTRVVSIDVGQIAELRNAIQQPSGGRVKSFLESPGRVGRLSLVGNLAHEVPGHKFAERVAPSYKQAEKEALVDAWLFRSLGM